MGKTLGIIGLGTIGKTLVKLVNDFYINITGVENLLTPDEIFLRYGRFCNIYYMVDYIVDYYITCLLSYIYSRISLDRFYA